MQIRIPGRIAAGRWLLATAVLGTHGFAATPPAVEEPAPPPRVEVEQQTVDLGDVTRGESVVATFVLRNAGGETLRILKAKPG